MKPALTIFLSITQISIFIVHYLVYKTLVTQIPFASDRSLFFAWTLFVGSLIFLSGSLLIQRLPSKISNWIYYVGAVWMGTLFLLLLASAVIAILNLAGFQNTILSTAIFVLALALSAYGVVNQKNIKVVEHTVKIENLPDSWVGRRGAIFTDSHYGPIHTAKDAKKLSEMIQKENVDIVFMSGDFYDGPPTDFEAVGREFKNLKPPFGKYFVTGNHEEYAGIESALKGIRAGDFVVTDGTRIVVEGVQIVGVPYERDEKEADMSTLLTKVGYDKAMPSIVLKHVPLDLDIFAKSGADLLIAGHTHKGQMWPFGLLTKHVYKGYDYGLKNYDKMQVLTSSGVGSWGPPQRIGTQSEIVILTFTK